MTVAILVPIHDKPQEVVEAVLESVRIQEAEEVFVILDRSPERIQKAVNGNFRIVPLPGRPGWRSPCIAANAGLKEITADITIYNPSDVVQAAGNIDKVRAHFEAHPNSVLFGRVTESDPEMCKGPGHAGPVLQGTNNLRPMTYLTAYPTKALRDCGAWDEAFQEGVCYEDDDLAARLWKHGLGFVFDDAFSGVHQSHGRLFDGNNASQGYWTDFRVGLNRTIMVNKHGRISGQAVVMQSKPLIVKEPGRVTWKHA
jgi:glycosyltransferase involved in cell wall biosynthesis